jgi:hypothetical protein
MNRFHPALPSREFHATSFGKAKTLILFIGLTGFFGWVAYGFTANGFLDDTSYREIAFVRDFFALLPPSVAVFTFAGLAALTAFATFRTISRMNSSLPELILSEAGINAYPNLRASSHGFLSWDDLASVSTYNGSVMIFYGKRASFMGKRTLLAVNLSEIGVAKKEMDALLQTYAAAGNLARQSGRAPVDFVYPAPKPKMDAAPAAVASAISRPPVAQARPEFAVKSPAPDFGRRMTRIRVNLRPLIPSPGH